MSGYEMRQLGLGLGFRSRDKDLSKNAGDDEQWQEFWWEK